MTYRRTVYRSLAELYPTYACMEHINSLKLLEKECDYSEHAIPQLEDVSNFLKSMQLYVFKLCQKYVNLRV